MAATHETLELGMIPQNNNETLEDIVNKDCKNTEDVCSESTPMNIPAANDDDPQPIEAEENQPNTNATLHSEQGKCSFILFISIYIVYIFNSRALKRKSLFHFSLCYRHQHYNRKNRHCEC